MRRLRFSLVIAVLLCGLNAPSLRAQTYLQNVGVPTFTTQSPVENGFVNLANGNLHLEIPLGSFAQRGGGVDKIVLMYDSTIWTWGNPINGTGGIWLPSNIPGSIAGWRLVTSGDTGSTTWGEYDSGWCPAEDDYAYAQYSPWIWFAPDGTQHSFPASTYGPLYPGVCGSSGEGTPNSGAYASDGSGFYISITNYTNATIYAPDGTVLSSADGTLGDAASVKTDPNGNQYTQSLTYPPYNLEYLDTLRRPVVDLTESSDGSTLYYAVPKPGGGTNTYTVKLETVDYHTNFGLSGVDENYGSFTAVSEVDLPDGTSYTFNYDSGTSPGNYGMLSKMTLPTGGAISYSFSNFADAYGNVSRWITGRTTPDSSTGWSYTPTLVSTCSSGQVNCEQMITVTEPSGDFSRYWSILNGGSWITDETFYNSSSNILSSATVCYNFVAVTNGFCTYPVTAAAPSTNIYKVAETDTLGSPGVNKTTEYGWDPSNNGELDTISEWNFGSSPSNAADRTTTLTYYQNGHNISHPKQVTVAAGGTNASQTTYGYDAGSSCACGNLTSVTQWLNTGTSPVTYYTYTSYGMPATMKDPNGNTTTYNYDGSGVYLSSIQYPTPSSGVQQIEHFSFDDDGGAILSYTDRNSNVTSYSYDGIGRLQTITYPPQTVNGTSVNGQTSFTYTSANQTQVSQLMDNNGNHKTTATILDGLGRVIQTQLTSDPEGTDYTDTSYDVDGRVASASNPHRSSGSPTDGTITYQYDGLNRIKQVTEQDGSKVATSYSGNCYTVTDEAGNTRNLCVDGFGRLTQVTENPGGNPTYITNYGYDANNNLISVSQGSQSRTFVYDSLSRLTTAYNPEISSAGQPCAVAYAYDNNGNVITKTSPKPNQTSCTTTLTTTYAYDQLNRLTGRTYNDGITPYDYYAYDQTAPWGFTLYNPIGRITTQGTYNGQNWLTESALSYDTMGRIILFHQSTPFNAGSWGWEVDNSYDLVGDLAWYTNGGGMTFSQNINNAGRVTQLTGSSTASSFPGTLATLDPNVGYYPNGTMQFLTLGNGLAEDSLFESRLQPCRLSLNSSATVLNGCGDPIASGNVLDFHYIFGGWGTTNNGDVTYWSGTYWTGGGVSFGRSYSYDGVNRLSAMSAPGDLCTGLSWTYDTWSNRNTQTETGGTCDAWQVTATAQNQLPGSPNYPYQYDAAGNLIYDGNYSYFYDAKNQLIQVGGTQGNCSTATACYVYDMDGRRVEKTVGGATTDYVYDYVSNHVTAEMQAAVLMKSYQYLNGQLIASESPNRFVLQTGVSVSIACNTTTFGDPMYGVVKGCYTQPSANGSGPAGYTFCANENSSCNPSGTNDIAFGANGSFYVWTNFTGGLLCGDSIFGDPAPGVTKSCYYRNSAGGSGPAGFSFCSAENSTCSFSGTQDVAFGANGTRYYFVDHLGTPREVTSVVGNVIDVHDYYPFGEEITTPTDGETHKFTEKERDSESGLDHFPARYYSSQFGRFMTPDPLGIFGADLTDPQTLNLYSYVRNNPVTLFDPTGLDPCDFGDPTCGCDPSDGCGGVFGNIPTGGGDGPQPPMYFPPGVGPNVNPPTGAGNPNDPFSGETFGIPNGMRIPGLTLGEILGMQSPPGLIFDDTAGGASGGNTSWLSTILLQTNVFISALGRNFADEFTPNGCFAQFAGELVGGQSADAGPPGAGTEDVIRDFGQASAATYVVTKGLSYPLKSSIYRSMLSGTETVAGVVALAPVDYAAGKAFGHEMQSLAAGTCK